MLSSHAGSRTGVGALEGSPGALGRCRAIGGGCFFAVWGGLVDVEGRLGRGSLEVEGGIRGGCWARTWGAGGACGRLGCSAARRRVSKSVMRSLILPMPSSMRLSTPCCARASTEGGALRCRGGVRGGGGFRGVVLHGVSRIVDGRLHATLRRVPVSYYRVDAIPWRGWAIVGHHGHFL